MTSLRRFGLAGLALAIAFLSYVVVTGEGGMISLCQITFAGIAAAITAQWATRHGVQVLIAILIGAAVAAEIKHILFSSTAAVYGAPERVPIEEGDQKQPINPYGASKLMTEQMLADAAAVPVIEDDRRLVDCSMPPIGGPVGVGGWMSFATLPGGRVGRSAVRRGAVFSSSSLVRSEMLLADGGLLKVCSGNASPGCGKASGGGGCLEAVSSSQRATAESEVMFTPGLAPDSSSPTWRSDELGPRRLRVWS